MNSIAETSPAIFKKCPCCPRSWPSRIALLTDPQVVIIGYQADFDAMRHGLFLFNHLACGTTMAIPAKELTDLYHGPRYQERMTGTAKCAGLCKAKSNLEACSAACEGAQYREIIQIVKNWPKTHGFAPR